ncbi:uncharacterized protein BXZ73DRAFT_85399 [Epithele typhae]|uniref:uncharacterized protein n=1 Tax=Epithele typhae TaxID=378194 RepID=UPI0020079BFA|nr:uncharacterized protein BXZ73DRAFT_85630 [Epithele typhae]XP_047870545.1 uncharacterized protein BXZ73DRAFT_85399 [Epithele typhae]KAH9901695.1 hypothetical protein BXZ73DRAFT_85630 [Epithele typhae]KAH9904245.1 hypothetical protein BXZ73DRAFT_85399 [Epithele typhae]
MVKGSKKKERKAEKEGIPAGQPVETKKRKRANSSSPKKGAKKATGAHQQSPKPVAIQMREDIEMLEGDASNIEVHADARSSAKNKGKQKAMRVDEEEVDIGSDLRLSPSTSPEPPEGHREEEEEVPPTGAFKALTLEEDEDVDEGEAVWTLTAETAVKGLPSGSSGSSPVGNLLDNSWTSWAELKQMNLNGQRPPPPPFLDNIPGALKPWLKIEAKRDALLTQTMVIVVMSGIFSPSKDHFIGSAVWKATNGETRGRRYDIVPGKKWIAWVLDNTDQAQKCVSEVMLITSLRRCMDGLVAAFEKYLEKLQVNSPSGPKPSPIKIIELQREMDSDRGALRIKFRMSPPDAASFWKLSGASFEHNGSNFALTDVHPCNSCWLEDHANPDCWWFGSPCNAVMSWHLIFNHTAPSKAMVSRMEEDTAPKKGKKVSKKRAKG